MNLYPVAKRCKVIDYFCVIVRNSHPNQIRIERKTHPDVS